MVILGELINGVDREAERASVDGNADATALVEAVEEAGYTAHA